MGRGSADRGSTAPPPAGSPGGMPHRFAERKAEVRALRSAKWRGRLRPPDRRWSHSARAIVVTTNPCRPARPAILSVLRALLPTSDDAERPRITMADQRARPTTAKRVYLDVPYEGRGEGARRALGRRREAVVRPAAANAWARPLGRTARRPRPPARRGSRVRARTVRRYGAPLVLVHQTSGRASLRRTGSGSGA